MTGHIDGSRNRQRGHQAAPDRPRDLHPLQHLRGDLPGRRDHARRPQLRRPRRRLQPLHGVHLAMPDRLDRQLADDAEGARLSDRGAADLGRAAARADARAARGRRRVAGRCRARGGRAGARGAARGGGRRGAVQFGRVRRDRAAVVGRASVREPVRPEESDHGDGGRQRQLHRSGLSQPDPPHRARLRLDAVPGPRRAVDRHRAAGSRCERPPAHRAPVLGREPAQRRAARLQQCLADGEAGDRGPPGPAGARRGVELRLRPEGRRHGQGDRPVRRRAS